MAPSVGALRHRVMVARRTRAPDPDFGFVETMTLTAYAWANIVAATEGVTWLDDATDATQPAVTHKFTVRRDRATNLPDARTYIVHANRRYKVLRVREEDQTGQFITLLAAAQETGAAGEDVPGWVLVDEAGGTLVSFP